MISNFSASIFRDQIDSALISIKKSLDVNVVPKAAEDVPHSYDDKFKLAEFIGESGIQSIASLLELDKAMKWASEDRKTVTLRFSSTSECSFIKSEKVTITPDSETISEVSAMGFKLKFGGGKTTKQEYQYNYSVNYKSYLFKGDDETDCIPLTETTTRCITCRYNTETPPHLKLHNSPPTDIDITWLFEAMNKKQTFVIDRLSKTTKTPRRNEEVENFIKLTTSLREWCSSVLVFFDEMLQYKHKGVLVKDEQIIETTERSSNLIFPVLYTSTDDDNITLPQPDDIVKRQLQDLKTHLSDVESSYSVDPNQQSQLFSNNEAHHKTVLLFLSRLCVQLESCFDYLEGMIRTQLIKAIGHDVSPADFAEYMDYHCRVNFKEQYRPKLFSYPVQGRKKHDPEGVVEIEGLHTINSSGQIDVSSKFLLDAVTEIEPNEASQSTSNNVFLHSFCATRFSDSDVTNVLKLKARSRQFCSFVLLIGKLVGEDYIIDQALLIQNRDQVEFILHLEDFKSNSELTALESISPEQREFALAYRKMQLESSLFALSIIEVKPQLERVLNVPPEILSQEIKLTQQLMELIIKYNIPADLLSYPEDSQQATSEDEIINKVSGYVSTVQNMLRRCKDQAVKDATESALANENFATGNEITTVKVPPVMSSTSGGQIRTASSLPGILQETLERECEGVCVRPTGIIVGNCSQTSQKGLLGKPISSSLSNSDLMNKKYSTLRLLSYLTKHGVVPIQYSTMHVFMATTHRFDKTLMNVLVQDNINPITLVERSAQLIAAAIHNIQPNDVLIGSP